jgi:hypothetical protein
MLIPCQKKHARLHLQRNNRGHPCTSYAVFRSSPSLYESPVVIANRLMLAPVTCRCAPQSYYQHNASYTI